MAQMGCLMLARVDGKSPVEYVRNEATKELIRETSRRILEADYEDLPPVLEWIERRLCRQEE
jgi:hypothetical protein